MYSGETLVADGVLYWETERKGYPCFTYAMTHRVNRGVLVSTRKIWAKSREDALLVVNHFNRLACSSLDEVYHYVLV